MLRHESFPIQNYERGRSSVREPWLAPERSWKEVYNGFVRDGRTQARRGYALLSDLYGKYDGLSITAPIVPSTSSSAQVDLTAENLSTGKPILAVRPHPVPGPYTFRCTDGTYTWTDNGDGTLSGSPGGTGIIFYTAEDPGSGTAGAVRIIIATDGPPIGTTLTIQSLEGNACLENVMACGEFIPESDPTDFRFWAVTDRRFYVWDASDRYFEDFTDRIPGAGGSASDIFTGDEDNRFWMQEFGDRLIMTNGVDEPWWYAPLDSGGASQEFLRKLKLTFDEDQPGGGANARRIWTAEIALRHQNRILWSNVKEGLVSGGIGAATSFTSRVRRTLVNDAEAFQDSDVAGGSLKVSDAPTNERIRSGGIRGNDPVYFFSNNQSWVHEYIGDPRNEYGWRELSKMRGSDAKKSAVNVYQDLLALDAHALIATDGRVVTDIDEEIPRFVIERLDFQYLTRSEGFVEYLAEQTWHTIYVQGSTVPQTLVRDYRNGAFAIFQWPFVCYGYFRDAVGRLIIDDYVPPDWPATVAEFDPDRPVDSYVGGSQEERIAIGGGTDQRIYTLLRDSQDANSEINFRAITQRLNPYKNDADVHLGWFHLLTTAHEGKTLTVRLYRDFSNTQYDTKILDLSPRRMNQKARNTVNVNAISAYHQIEFEAVDVPGFAIESIDLHMAPVAEQVTPV